MSRARTITTGAAVLVSGVFAVRNLVPGGETFPFVKTKGVSNIEQRYTAGGGTPTHTAGTATVRGSHENVIPPGKKWEMVQSRRVKALARPTGISMSEISGARVVN